MRSTQPTALRPADSSVALAILAVVSLAVSALVLARPVAASHDATSPDVVVDKAASASTVALNDLFSYTLEVGNVGASQADGVVLTDNFDNDLQVNGWTASQGTCSLAAGNQITCSVGAIAAAGSATVTVDVTATPDTCGQIDNQAAVAASNEPAEHLENNASERVVVTVECGDGDADNILLSVMKHVCPDEIQSQAAFDALGSFANKVADCPVITRPGDSGPAGALDAGDAGLVPGGQTSFDFSVTDENGLVSSIGTGGAAFVPAVYCEAALGDVDGNPSNNLCFEASHYMFSEVEDGLTTVTEVAAPAGYRYGALEFTPDSLHPNTDDETLISAANGVIVLDTSTQSDVMLHVFNFANLEAQLPGVGTPKPPSQPPAAPRESVRAAVPNVAMEPPTPATFPVGALALLLVSSLGTLAYAHLRSARRH